LRRFFTICGGKRRPEKNLTYLSKKKDLRRFLIFCGGLYPPEKIGGKKCMSWRVCGGLEAAGTIREH
jgi:hypothetical protein